MDEPSKSKLEPPETTLDLELGHLGPTRRPWKARMGTQWIGSPNKAKGREGFKPEAIVIHTMEGTLEKTDAWFLNKESAASAHYGIGRHGEIHQYVDESNRAWHVGRIFNPTWPFVKPDVNPNWYTIGIEHEGEGDTPWSDEMYNASAQLIYEICRRWAIPCDRDHIIGHHEIRADKTCPGVGVDLDKLVAMANKFQRQPITFNVQPGFDSEDVQGTQASSLTDLLSVDDDARAFASLISSKTLVPPLSIGVFADWGSGKSFFMRKIQHWVRTIADQSKQAGASNTAFCENVVQIE